MALTQYGYIGGISSLAIVILCYLGFVKFLARYTVSKRIETLLQGVVLFAIGSNWFAGTISFFLVLSGGEALGHVPVIWSWSWTPVVIGTAWIYLVFSLIRPKLKIPITSLYGVINIYFLYLMYVKTTEYSKVQSIGGLPSSEVLGIAALFLFFDLLSTIVLIGPMYLYIGFKSKKEAIRLRGRLIGIGVILFAFFAIFETVLPASAFLLVFSRIMILFSIGLMYGGFTLPHWLQRRFLVEEISVT